MASTGRDHERLPGVEFVREDDGTITARDVDSGIERGGQTKAEALVQLAEVLALEAGEGVDIEDPDEFLESIGVEPEDDVDAPNRDPEDYPWG